MSLKKVEPVKKQAPPPASQSIMDILARRAKIAADSDSDEDDNDWD